jgi:CDP-6-deoxy-D-xylo-4-hexulose-3-dehydrase
MKVKYKLASNTWDEREENAIMRVLRSKRYTMGDEVDVFEEQFAKFIGVKHAIMTNSGSSANLVACAAFKYANRYDLGTVIVPAVSWSTTFFPLSQMGYKLKFIDVDILTLNIDLVELENNITSDVVGVCGVSLLGNPSGMDKIRKICDENKLFFYEDNCESLGASIDGKLAGSYGDISTHSFFFSHHLQTMEGGMVTTDDDEYAQLCRSLRAHGWTRDKKSGDLSDSLLAEFHKSYEFVLPGYCVRPIEFMGALGQVQLAKWPEMRLQRIKNAELFIEICEKYKKYLSIQDCGSYESTWFGFAILLNQNERNNRETLIEIFKRRGIEYRPIVAGNFTKQKVMKYLDHVALNVYPVADHVHDNGVFVGNDAKELLDELGLLDEALSEYVEIKKSSRN